MGKNRQQDVGHRVLTASLSSARAIWVSVTGRTGEQIHRNLRAFVDKQMTTHHDVVEYWDSGRLKVSRGFVTMKFNDPSKRVGAGNTVFFHTDEADQSKVRAWYGSAGPVEF